MKRSIIIVMGLTCVTLVRAADLQKSQKPASKQAIYLLLENSSAPLSVDSSCKHVGSNWTDKTIGQYVAGLMAEQVSPGTNWIEASCSTPDRIPEAAWTCEVTFLRQDNEDRWRWGVKFSLDSRGQVMPKSFRCIGAG